MVVFILLIFYLAGRKSGTLYGVCLYPEQTGAWAMVHAGKWGVWSC